MIDFSRQPDRRSQYEMEKLREEQLQAARAEWKLFSEKWQRDHHGLLGYKDERSRSNTMRFFPERLSARCEPLKMGTEYGARIAEVRAQREETKSRTQQGQPTQQEEK